MRKGLEALREIKHFTEPFSDFRDFDKHYKIIEKELKAYEEYKQILSDYDLSLADFRHACFTFAQFKNSKGFEGVEKKLKALEIIKNKKPVVLMLYLSKDFEFYNASVYGVAASLNEQEFNLLKEWLEK